MNALWFVMLAVGLLTFLTRLSFILLQDKWQPPAIVTRGLRFVPVAVLTAIFVPEILLVENQLALSLSNMRLMAGLIAILVAYKTKSALWTIAVGMGAFWLLTWLI
jgi:branched-subunit amino acid transport protein